MVEVLGTVAAAIQVAELGARLSVKLCTFAHKFKNANKALRSLSNDVALTCSVLRQLSESLGQDDLVSLYSPDAFATAQDVLEECEKVFKDLEGEIEQHQPDASPANSRMERATRKIRFLMNEPRLDSVAGNLERLKSTMLLMLNVIIYAGQLRSRREVSEAQEQRELLQMLTMEKVESERKFEQLTASIQFISLNVQSNQTGPVSVVQNHNRVNDELQHYYDMAKAIIGNIDKAQQFLDTSRYQRVKDGFIKLHLAEASRFNQTYGARAWELFSQLGITQPKLRSSPMGTLEPQHPHYFNPTNPRKRSRAMNDDRVPISPQLPAVFETAPSAFPQGPAPHQTFGDSSVPDVSAFNDLSASNNPDILESFDFETFLNTDGDEAGFNFGLNLPFAPEEAPKVEDTSPENPDVWILRWTTLEKTELHHLDPIDAPGL